MGYNIDILSLRRKFKVKQKDLAEACGISVVALCNLERGRCIPNNETIEKIYDFLKIQSDEIIDIE